MGAPWARDFAKTIKEGMDMGRQPSLMGEQQAMNRNAIEQGRQANEYSRQVNPALIQQEQAKGQYAMPQAEQNVEKTRAEIRDYAERAKWGGGTPQGFAAIASQVGSMERMGHPDAKMARELLDIQMAKDRQQLELNPIRVLTEPSKISREIAIENKKSQNNDLTQSERDAAQTNERQLRLKRASDLLSPVERKRIDDANNLHKTLSKVDINSFRPYVGADGQARFKAQQASAKLYEATNGKQGSPLSSDALKYIRSTQALKYGTHQYSGFFDTPAAKELQNNLIQMAHPQSMLMTFPEFKERFGTNLELTKEESGTFVDRELESVEQINKETNPNYGKPSTNPSSPNYSAQLHEQEELDKRDMKAFGKLLGNINSQPGSKKFPSGTKFGSNGEVIR